MKMIYKNSFESFALRAESLRFGGVFPRAVITGRQSGEIFVDDDAVLIRHRCGFAWAAGQLGEAELNEIPQLRESIGGRILLFTDDAETIRHFEACGTAIGRRLFFEYSGGTAGADIPGGYSVREIDSELFGILEGRVAPRLFWSDAGEFLRSGRGFCIMHGNEPAAWAFTSAADGREADLGVETSEDHRGKGLAYAAVWLTVTSVLAGGMKPVWACDSGNAASRGLARKSGFEFKEECRVVRLV